MFGYSRRRSTTSRFARAKRVVSSLVRQGKTRKASAIVTSLRRQGRFKTAAAASRIMRIRRDTRYGRAYKRRSAPRRRRSSWFSW